MSTAFQPRSRLVAALPLPRSSCVLRGLRDLVLGESWFHAAADGLSSARAGGCRRCGSCRGPLVLQHAEVDIQAGVTRLGLDAEFVGGVRAELVDVLGQVRDKKPSTWSLARVSDDLAAG